MLLPTFIRGIPDRVYARLAEDEYGSRQHHTQLLYTLVVEHRTEVWSMLMAKVSDMSAKFRNVLPYFQNKFEHHLVAAAAAVDIVKAIIKLFEKDRYKYPMAKFERVYDEYGGSSFSSTTISQWIPSAFAIYTMGTYRDYPLKSAVKYGSFKLVKMLLDTGASPGGYCPRENSNGPLWAAVQENKPVVLQLLPRYGADPTYAVNYHENPRKKTIGMYGLG
ncbi:hypothetical protein BU25DRAFT_483194 [Macroventuria anomochaeta]|uniref:Uncharacterized protein n=1 Tax=Macroventuria anomochaeta TaxID=301207 RepID=A0ACB6RIJ9_9PLEO|nr:uncharacterized protein BU25DRAFT_483194 [Macroventuria anomochaeta]KAF2621235.1 hypothetical protein BU25DRAFT_483194 [Macroventuria anomochaeta]